MKLNKIPQRIDAKWLLDRLDSVSIKKTNKRSEAGQLARQSNAPESRDAFLRGREISRSLFAGLQRANGETGEEVTLKNADGTLTKAGELFQQLDEARVGRDAWFDPPRDGQVMYADFRPVDMGYFRGNDGRGDAIRVTGAPSSELTIYWAPAGDQHLMPPTNEAGVLYYERGTSVDVQRSGNTSINDWAASIKTKLSGDGLDDAEGVESLKAKNLNRDPSMVRRPLSADFFSSVLKVPTQRIAPLKLFMNGWYQGLRDMEEPLDKAMWKSAVKRVDPERDVPDDVWIFGAQWQAGVDAIGGGRLTMADLRYRKSGSGDDGGNQYRARGSEQTYDLKTGKKKGDEAYEQFAHFVRTLNGIGLRGPDGQEYSANDASRFNTDAYRESVERSMDVYEMLRAYTGLILTGAWDNIVTPSNFAWVGEREKSGKMRWSALPIDLDSTWGIGWDGQPRWQDLDVLLRDGSTRNTPVIWKNLLANDHFKAYVLDYMEHVLNTEFRPERIEARVRGLWDDRRTAVYQESDTPTGPAHTGRPFTNDLIQKHNDEKSTVRQNGLYAPAIVNFVEWRRQSAQAQIDDVRKTFTRRAGVDFGKGELEPKS